MYTSHTNTPEKSGESKLITIYFYYRPNVFFFLFSFFSLVFLLILEKEK